MLRYWCYFEHFVDVEVASKQFCVQNYTILVFNEETATQLMVVFYYTISV
jgi:hypothetical protein